MKPQPRENLRPERWRPSNLAPLFALVALAGCAGHTAVVEPKPLGVPDVVIPTSITPQKPMPDGYVPGVPNFGFITADVWRGAQPTAQGFKSLAAMGCKTVIDLQEVDESAIMPKGLRYVHLPTSQWLADRVNVVTVLAAIESSPKPVFVHCHVGHDRTGLVVAAYRIGHGMKLSQALEELRNFHVGYWWRSKIEARIKQLARQAEKTAVSAH